MNPFHVTGYFEEVLDASTRECLGTRPIKKPMGRSLGSKGMRSTTLTKPTTLARGPKLVTVKVKPGTRRRVLTIVHARCGRSRWTHPLDRKEPNHEKPQPQT